MWQAASLLSRKWSVCSLYLASDDARINDVDLEASIDGAGHSGPLKVGGITGLAHHHIFIWILLRVKIEAVICGSQEFPPADKTLSRHLSTANSISPLSPTFSSFQQISSIGPIYMALSLNSIHF